jgi:hypothetical protein
MTRIKMALAAGAVAASMFTGGVLGAALWSTSAVAASAASTTTAATAATAATPTPGAASGTFVSNENATHEAGESAAREAQENAGQMPTVP